MKGCIITKVCLGGGAGGGYGNWNCVKKSQFETLEERFSIICVQWLIVSLINTHWKRLMLYTLVIAPLVPRFPPSCSLFQRISGIFIFICVLRVHILLSFNYFLSVFLFVFAVFFCLFVSFRLILLLFVWRLYSFPIVFCECRRPTFLSSDHIHIYWRFFLLKIWSRSE